MSLKDKIYLSIFALLPFIFFYPMYFLNKINFWLDMLYYFMPMREICAQNLREGILPLWNPYIYCGNPLLANMQSAVFYPLSIFYYILPFDIALRISTYLTFFIMSVFFYSYIRLNNISEEGSFFPSLIFSYNYYMLIKAVELADINVLMWIPAVLYFTKKYCLQRKINDLFFIIFTLSLSFLGGHLQVFSYVYFLFILIIFYEMFFSNEKQEKQTLLFFKLSIFITLALIFIVFIQLFPTLKFIIHSKRNMLGLNFEESNLTYIRIEQILMFFFPFLMNLFSESVNFYNWVSLINPGILAIIIFFTGCYTIGNLRLKNFWLIIFTFVLFICVLGNLPFYEFIFYNFKPLQYVRYVVKINIVLLFIICFFIAFGFDNIFKYNKNDLNKLKKIFFIIFYFLTTIFLLLVIFKIPLLKFYKKIFEPLMSFEKTYDIVISYDLFLKDFFIYIIYFFISLIILHFIIMKKIPDLIAKNIFILLIFLFLIWSFIKGNFTYAKYSDIYNEPSIISKIKNTPNINNKRILSPGIIDPFKKNIIFSSEKELVDYYLETLYPNIPLLYKIRNVDGFDSLFLGNFHKFKLLMSYNEKPWDYYLFKLFSAEYVIAKKELKGKNIILKDKKISYLYQNRDFLDISFFVPSNANLLFIDENDRQYQKYFEKPFDPLLQIIFYLKDKYDIQKLIANSEKENKINKVLSLEQKSINEYEVIIKNENSGFLILTDNNYPGWEAYINGVKAKIYTAYLTFKCVYLNKGINKVKFIFIDKTLLIGSIISLIFLFIILFYTALYIRKF